jgi:hypothetical protein
MRVVRFRPRALVLLGMAVALAVLVFPDGGARPAAAQPLEPHYKCYSPTVPGTPLGVTVDLETQFGVQDDVEVGAALELCTPALKNGEGNLEDWPELRCYDIVAGHDPPDQVHLTTQFGEERNVAVGQAERVCVPALKATPPDPPPSPPVPTVPHYECYYIDGDDPDAAVDLETQFGLEPGVEVGEAQLLCAPALKNGEGDLDMPHLKCYQIVDSVSPITVNLTTQFGPEENQEFNSTAWLCVPALKTASVGGVAELPALAETSAEETAAPADGSGWSAGAYAALAGGLAAAALALGGGALYARRRWLS